MNKNKKKSPKIYKTEFPVVNKVSELDFSRMYSYGHYLRWEFEDRLELIRGKIFKMTAPARLHQDVSGEIFGEIHNCLKNRSCSVYAAPFDVRFPGKSLEDKDIFTVVQPDIVVVCDPGKLDEKGCIGAPDIAVEILSPGNSRKELQIKYQLYEEYGVREYWIVDPAKRTFVQNILNDEGRYVSRFVYTGNQNLVSEILPGFSLSINEVFGHYHKAAL